MCVVHMTINQETRNYHGSLASKACSMNVRMVDRVLLNLESGVQYIYEIYEVIPIHKYSAP